MKIFGKHVFPRQIVLLSSGLLFLAATTYDVHRSIKNNQAPPSKEQLQALEDYLKSVRRPP
ncbi:WD_REPEATS_REGION domain-containing protein [Psidium guajava]|nr:WD_REPEATS_REGION domain-containing protein [Psidium guajava]